LKPYNINKSNDLDKIFIFIHIIYQKSGNIVIEPIIFTYLNLDNKDTLIQPKSQFTYEEAIKITSPKVDKNIEQFKTNIELSKQEVWSRFLDKKMNNNLEEYFWNNENYWNDNYLKEKKFRKLNKIIKPFRNFFQFILNKKIDLYFGLGFRKNIFGPIITTNTKLNLLKKYYKNIYAKINPEDKPNQIFINNNININPILDDNTSSEGDESIQINYNLLDIGKSLPTIQIDNKDYLLGTPYLQEDKYYRNIYEEDGTLYGNIRYNELSIEDKDIEKDININICTSK
jgi:hypothetical protein